MKVKHSGSRVQKSLNHQLLIPKCDNNIKPDLPQPFPFLTISEFEEEGKEGLDQEQAGRRQGEAQLRKRQEVNKLIQRHQEDIFRIVAVGFEVLLNIFVLSLVCL